MQSLAQAVLYRNKYRVSRLQAGCRLLRIILICLLFINSSCSTLPHTHPADQTPITALGNTPASALPTAVAVSNQPDSTPRLRIEPGLHTAMINRIAVDQAERFVVSASDDKTARVWDANSGQLLRILRPPIAEGDEGKLYAVAISPNGEHVAVGGWTGHEWDKTVSIYIFNRETGEIHSRIRNLPSVILHLAYSAYGKVLAATLGAGEGVRFYAVAEGTEDYQELARDSNYTDSSYSNDFDQQGRSVTSSLDGYIRLYNAQFKQLLRTKAPGGKQPFFARFSPDGRHIAVDFYNSTAINLLSATDLSLLESPDTSAYTQGNMARVAWSLDGHWLYAGGRYYDGKGSPVIAWPTDSLSAHKVYRAAQNTVMDIKPLADGGLIVASADPALTRLDAKGQLVWQQGAGKLDYRGYTALREFSLSSDGHILGFHYRYENQQGEVEYKTARWAVADLSFSNASDTKDFNPLLGLNPPRLSATELDIRDWEDEHHPSLNGTVLQLEDYEFSRSLAISSSMYNTPQSFALGTEFRVRLYNQQGSLQWQQPVSVAWAVNISADWRYVVAALGDGTIRWYNLNDGKERLAFYLHPDAIKDQPRWIAWTPDGFYATSSKAAEALMGFHINQGADQAGRFVEAGQLSEVFARADLVARALDDDYPQLAATALQRAGDIQQILAKGIAPQIQLQGEQTIHLKQRDFELVFTLQDQGGGLGKLEYYVDGKLMSSGGSRPFAPRQPGAQTGYRRAFTLPHGEHTVSVIAYNKQGNVASKPAEQRVIVDDPVHREPSLYVLSVGISTYRDQYFNLRYAADDAIDFATLLKKQGRQLYQRVVTQTLVDQEATLAEIGAAFESIARKIQAQDVFVLYLAGHGTVSDGRYHFIPYDLIYENTTSLSKGGLNEAKLKALLGSVETGKRMMVIDSCHAGKAIPALAALSSRSRGPSINDKAAIIRLMNATGIAILAAASKEQEAKEGIIENDQGHGLFTHVLLKGLSGAADGLIKKDRQIDVEELISYTRTEVPRISREKWQYEQLPMYQSPKQNFPISLIH